jgi:hypothetical protein
LPRWCAKITTDFPILQVFLKFFFIFRYFAAHRHFAAARFAANPVMVRAHVRDAPTAPTAPLRKLFHGFAHPTPYPPSRA